MCVYILVMLATLTVKFSVLQERREPLQDVQTHEVVDKLITS